MEYFQDDIYIPTRDLETPVLSAREWFEGVNRTAPLTDLKPPDMMPCNSFVFLLTKYRQHRWTGKQRRRRVLGLVLPE
jgi:hypothetical protein